MKAVTMDIATGKVREFESEEAAYAYAKENGYHAQHGGYFPHEAKDEVIETARSVFGVGNNEADKKLSDYDRGARDVLWALAHLFAAQGHAPSHFHLHDIRVADFELLHGLADAIRSGKSNGPKVVEAINGQTADYEH